jgi:uncharacterized protein (DUF1501 family)
MLNSLAAGALSRVAVSNAWAAPAEYRALVCVLLAGGNDCNNTVVPLSTAGYAGYATARTASLALAQNVLLPVKSKSGKYQASAKPPLWACQNWVPSISAAEQLISVAKFFCAGQRTKLMLSAMKAAMIG